ncbi:hypothetical protein BD560DRAFT_384256 [Blakeslea trispora]|nr:hypothetical protein BD560DRAFT_384256 [Blakeslea trispora]
MKGKLVIIYLIRLIILILSLATLGCHVAQLALLSQSPDIENWWPGYVPYTLYYVGSIVSILSVTFILIFGCFMSKSLLSDRIISLINIALCIAVAVYTTLKSGTIPWTGSTFNSFSSPMHGYVNYCSFYSDSMLSSRCWLSNGTWLGIVLSGFFWFMLALVVFILKSPEIYDEDYDTYDFKEDVPMANEQPLMQSSIHSTRPIPPQHYYMPNKDTYMMSPTVPRSPLDHSPTRDHGHYGYQA